jgi:hypothetical protein
LDPRGSGAPQRRRSMSMTPLNRRARNRLREHDLVVIRRGTFRGEPAILTACRDPRCDWMGWFTTLEMSVDAPDTQEPPDGPQPDDIGSSG